MAAKKILTEDGDTNEKFVSKFGTDFNAFIKTLIKWFETGK